LAAGAGDGEDFAEPAGFDFGRGLSLGFDGREGISNGFVGIVRICEADGARRMPDRVTPT
jgi:hypothetical protein